MFTNNNNNNINFGIEGPNVLPAVDLTLSDYNNNNF